MESIEGVCYLWGPLGLEAPSTCLFFKALASTSTKRGSYSGMFLGAAQQAWPSSGPGPLNINMNARIDGLNPQSFGEPGNLTAIGVTIKMELWVPTAFKV